MSKANSKDKGLNKLNLEIKYLPINQIYPYDNNPRKNDKGVKPLMESIKKFGFSFPITIDKENVIISGHTRYKAALKLKLKEDFSCGFSIFFSNFSTSAIKLVSGFLSL